MEWLYEKYPNFDFNSLPEATKIAGLILDDPRLDGFFAEIATPQSHELHEARPPDLDSQDELSVDSEGFAIVAGDGAAPGQTDFRLRRAGCGLFYGDRHSHNSTLGLEGVVHNAQRAELRSALRWALWNWTRSIYLTDSSYVCRGLLKIINQQKTNFKSHRDLRARLQAAIEAKGHDNFRTRKIQSHQTKEQKDAESEADMRLRLKNEEADKRATTAARLKAINGEFPAAHKARVKREQDHEQPRHLFFLGASPAVNNSTDTTKRSTSSSILQTKKNHIFINKQDPNGKLHNASHAFDHSTVSFDTADDPCDSFDTSKSPDYDSHEGGSLTDREMLRRNSAIEYRFMNKAQGGLRGPSGGAALGAGRRNTAPAVPCASQMKGGLLPVGRGGLRSRRDIGVPVLQLGALRSAPASRAAGPDAFDSSELYRPSDAPPRYGSMGTVRLAWRRSDGLPVALKEVSCPANMEEAKELTRREYEIMSALSHHSIVRAFAIHEAATKTVVCMEYCDNGCLKSYVRKHGAMAPPAATPIARQVLEGLDCGASASSTETSSRTTCF
ncbi:unnamed protein product [Prorocentrum cordatum]|uniref:Protein kinase domain-containing protein n=1 Tax=Prorocentrum cordatum TaxID=2364126 RepID=A0ABN9RVY7_9DINO|nr:unnamed protein product [Polarella glacialis]